MSFIFSIQQKTVTSECLVLGVTTGDAWSDVKVAYRRLAHEFHPDKQDQTDGESAEKTARFRAVQEAYEFLEENKEDFGVPASTSSTSSANDTDDRSNTTEDVPDPEYIRIDNFTAYIKYERTWYGSLVAYLEIEIEDVPKLKWFPVPTHSDHLREVRVVRGAVQVMIYNNYFYSVDVSDFRREFAAWKLAEQRRQAADRLRSRFESYSEILNEMRKLSRPIARLSHLFAFARAEYWRLTSDYRPSTPSQVEKEFDKVDREIERLRQGGPQLIIDDLIEGVIFHSDVTANQAVLDEVRSWHIRTGGFIDLIDESVLRAFYERRITSEKMSDLELTDLRLELEDYVLEDLLEEFDEVAPAVIELEAAKGVAAYPVTYDYFDRDGQKVPVATITLPLRVYEHNAAEYGKSSQFPVLPFGIELRVEILFENNIIFSGMPGDELDKKITKFKRGRSRGKAMQGTVNDSLYGSGHFRPVDSTPLPPWFKGARPRW